MFMIVYCLGSIGVSIQTLLMQITVGGILYMVGSSIILFSKKDTMFMNLYQKRV